MFKDQADPTDQEIVDAIRELLLVLDSDLKVLSANRNFYDTFKVTPEKTVGSLVYDLGNRQWNIPKLRMLLEDILSDKNQFDNYEVEHVFPTIGHKIMLLNARRIIRKGVGSTQILLAIEDITERRRLKGLLEESEQRYRRLFETANDGILLLEKSKGIITHANSSTTKILGYSKEEFIGSELVDVGFPPYTWDVQEILITLEKEGIIHYKGARIRSKTGPMIDTDIYLVDKAELIQCNIRDITEHKQAEDALRASVQKYSVVLENTNEAIFIAQDGLLKYVNPATVRLLDYVKEVLLPKPFLEFIHPEDRSMVLERHMKRVGGEDIAERYSFRIETGAGTIKWVEIHASRIEWEGRPATINFLSDITERKQAEDALRVSEQKYRLVLENAGEVIFIAQDGMLKYVNPAAARLIDYAEEVILSKPFIEFIHPEDRSMVLERHMKRLRGEDIAEPYFSFRLETGAGTVKWVEIHATRIEWEGRPATINFLSDITERREAEARVKESEEKYRTILDEIEEGYQETDLAGNFTFFNEAFLRILGCNRDELMGTNFRQYAAEEAIAKKLYRVYNQIYEMGIPLKSSEWEIIRKDGARRTLEFFSSLLRDSNDRPTGFRGIVRDITEKKKSQEALHESEEKYRSIFENVQEGIYRITPEGKIIMANQAMAKMYGYDSPQGIMAAITDVTRQLYVHPEEREKMKGIIETHGSVRNYEVHQYRRNGSTFWLSLTMQAVRDETGRILCYDGISEDITDRKESFEKLRKALGATVHAIAVVVETRDPYTAGHQRRVADLARAIATEMGLTTDQIDGVRMAGVIHDLGKISVPAEILSKPTKLTNLEFRLIKTHAQSGYDILKNIEFPWPIARMVLEHHERMDGSGYPNGLTGDKLLIESRILAVADVVEAIASFRPYRPAVGLDEALDEITKNKGNLYDPEVVDVCLRLFHEKGYKIID